MHKIVLTVRVFCFPINIVKVAHILQVPPLPPALNHMLLLFRFQERNELISQKCRVAVRVRLVPNRS